MFSGNSYQTQLFSIKFFRWILLPSARVSLLLRSPVAKLGDAAIVQVHQGLYQLPLNWLVKVASKSHLSCLVLLKACCANDVKIRREMLIIAIYLASTCWQRYLGRPATRYLWCSVARRLCISFTSPHNLQVATPLTLRILHFWVFSLQWKAHLSPGLVMQRRTRPCKGRIAELVATTRKTGANDLRRVTLFQNTEQFESTKFWYKKVSNNLVFSLNLQLNRQLTR